VADERDKLNKVLALAMHPETIRGEALAAFERARHIVKTNPALAHPPTPQTPGAPPPTNSPQAKYSMTITNVHPDWILVLVHQLSKRAFDLDLKCQIGFDFSQQLTGVKLHWNGPEKACQDLEWSINWCVNYVNQELKKTPRP
jgi:hypothetical protein